MDIVIEIFLEVYMELMLLMVPEHRIGRRHKLIAWVIAVAVLTGVFALVIWGVHLIVERDSLFGVIPLTIAAFISVAQITAGVILYGKKHQRGLDK